MALDSLPPWLNVGPTDYLRAVQAGGSAGLGIAESQNRAREAAARRDDAARAAAQQQWEFGERMRQAAEEHASKDVLERAHLDQQAAQLAQQGQYQTGMLGYHNRSLDDAMARAEMQNQQKGELLDLRDRHYADLMDWRNQLMDQRERLAANKVGPTDYETVTETVPEVTSEIPAQPARPFEKKSLLGIDWLWPDQQASPATPAIEPHGERKITKRLRIGGGLGGIPALPELGGDEYPKEVIKPLKNGRMAVFDPDTKEFLRYAD